MNTNELNQLIAANLTVAVRPGEAIKDEDERIEAVMACYQRILARLNRPPEPKPEPEDNHAMRLY